MTETSKIFLFSLIMISNSLFIIYWIAQFFDEIRLTVLKKTPKIYLICFACCNMKNVVRETQKQEYLTKNAATLIKIEKAKDCKIKLFLKFSKYRFL